MKKRLIFMMFCSPSILMAQAVKQPTASDLGAMIGKSRPSLLDSHVIEANISGNDPRIIIPDGVSVDARLAVEAHLAGIKKACPLCSTGVSISGPIIVGSHTQHRKLLDKTTSSATVIITLREYELLKSMSESCDAKN